MYAYEFYDCGVSENLLCFGLRHILSVVLHVIGACCCWCQTFDLLYVQSCSTAE